MSHGQKRILMSTRFYGAVAAILWGAWSLPTAKAIAVGLGAVLLIASVLLYSDVEK